MHLSSLLTMENIPVIDISGIALTSERPSADSYKKVSQSLAEALSTWGFAYISNHGVDARTISSCFQESEKFFCLPQPIKDKYARGVQSIQGYSRTGREVLEDDSIFESKESLDVQTVASSGDLPDFEVPNLRRSLDQFLEQGARLTERLLRCLAIDLHVDQDKFISQHAGMFKGAKGNASSLRLLHYPPLIEPRESKKVTRCGTHTDYGGLTLLLQDKLGGLEVRSAFDGEEWTKAPPIAGTIVVNIGDVLQFWSANKYRATPHRVAVDAETCARSRFSMALFIHPDHDTPIEPLGAATERKPRTALEHIQQRFSETYYK